MVINARKWLANKAGYAHIGENGSAENIGAGILRGCWGIFQQTSLGLSE